MLNPTTGIVFQALSQDAANALPPGKTFAAVVRSQPQGLFTTIGAIQIPLDAGVGLEEGQRILIQVQRQGDGIRLDIRPQSTSAAGQSPSISTILASLLRAEGRTELARQGATILPRQTPANAATIQAFVTTLLSDRGTGQDLLQLQQFITSATSQGVLSPDVGTALSPWLALTALADAAAWQDLVRRARSEREAIARLAQRLGGTQTGTSLADLKESIRTLTKRLMTDEQFQQWLRSNGSADDFKALADRTLERATGRDVQNLRSLDQSYQFLELPITEKQGFKRLQMHLFSESKGESTPQKNPVHRTVLDLELTRLGPLWIDLSAHGQRCTCTIEAAASELVEEITNVATDLETALTALGYTNVRVQASLMNGSRESALIALLAPFKALNLEA